MSSRACRRRYLGAVLGTIGLLCAASAQADRFEAIRERIRADLVDYSIPSVAVAVVQNGKIVWEQGFGWADREQRLAATEHTVYSLASVTKPMTGTGLMTLVQAGRIDLERPINDYLGAAKLRARVGDVNLATVRRVADHSSGLPVHWQFFYADEPYRQPSIDATILHYGNLVTAPGERFNYTNLGYGILDHVISRISARAFADFMRQEVFLPLGMTRSSVELASALRPYAATRYGTDGLPLPDYTANHPGASAVYSSVHDVARFALFHLQAHLADQKAILTDASLDEMHRRTTDRGAGFGYGLGFEVSQVHGYRMVHHSGGMDGVATNLMLFPDQRLGIVVLQNSRTHAGPSIAELIAHEMLPNWPLVNWVDRPSTTTPYQTPQPLRGIWKGVLATYVADVPLELRFTANDTVEVRLGGQLATLVDQPRFQDRSFNGDFKGRIGTPDTDQYDYTISLALKLRGNVLNGAATAIQQHPVRGRAALSHWVELDRQ